ncbi:hypothetical protein MUK42_04653 [Musa troglodytarum]|uniref:Uncharacterized protein n=1 Tax=Musa troglodytarum TaxID=320322 RepID=A0A9E7G4V7_9LILI|nr:hypothetical protein MUK42_04653 [Musa troglodytarum]
MTNAMATSKEADRSQYDIHMAPLASKRPPSYLDILDMVGIDYAAATASPPVHN